MGILLLFAFLPPLLLNTLLSSASQTTYGFITPEFTDLIVTGPFLVKIVESQTKPVQITVNQAGDIRAVSVSIIGNTVEIEPNATDRRSIHMQINVSSKLLKSIKVSSGARIVSNWKDFGISNITLTDNGTASFTNITSQDLTLNLSSSSKLTIGNIDASNVDISATQNSSVNANKGQINYLIAVANSDAYIRLIGVKINGASLTKNNGSNILAVIEKRGEGWTQIANKPLEILGWQPVIYRVNRSVLTRGRN